MTFINIHQVKNFPNICSSHIRSSATDVLLYKLIPRRHTLKLIFYTWGVLVDLFEKHTHYLN